MPRFAAALAVLAFAPLAPAAPLLDPQATEPYVWRVVIAARPHPRLPATIREQVARDVRAALVPLAGDVARVEVFDLGSTPPEKWDPFWKRLADRGWAALDLSEARKVTGAKTHFVRLEFRDGGYRVECRQIDGDTGLFSPVVRARETAAPETLGRLAGLMVGRDFGPVATVEQASPKEGTAVVRFRAGAVAGFDRFVRAGDVLAVAAVVEAGGKAPANGPPPRSGQPRAFTLLQLTAPPAADGTARCKLFSMYASPLPTVRGVVGFRGLLLATAEAPLSVRLVKPGTETASPVSGLTRVRGSDLGFPDRPDPREALVLKDGLYRTPRAMRNIACLTVGVAAGKEVRFPVPVLGDGLPVAVPFEANEADAAKAEFERACEEVRVRAAEVRTAQVALFEALTEMIKKGENPAALARVAAGIKNTEAADKEIADALAALRADPRAKEVTPAALLAATERQMEVVRGNLPAFRERQDQLAAANEKSKDPVRFEREFRAKDLQARIKQHVQNGEIPAALALYDELAEVTKDAAAVKLRDKLAASWEPKDPAQTAAREYVAGPWRQTGTPDDYKAAVKPLTDAVDVLLKFEDAHGLRSFLASVDPAYTRLKELTELLDPGSMSDRPQLEDLNRVVKAVRDLETRAREQVKKAEDREK